MTCIIGYLDKKNKVSWIGGDGLRSNGKITWFQNPRWEYVPFSDDSVVEWLTRIIVIQIPQ